jgi:hypothetical protein
MMSAGARARRGQGTTRKRQQRNHLLDTRPILRAAARTGAAGMRRQRVRAERETDGRGMRV